MLTRRGNGKPRFRVKSTGLCSSPSGRREGMSEDSSVRREIVRHAHRAGSFHTVLHSLNKQLTNTPPRENACVPPQNASCPISLSTGRVGLEGPTIGLFVPKPQRRPQVTPLLRFSPHHTTTIHRIPLNAVVMPSWLLRKEPETTCDQTDAATWRPTIAAQHHRR